MICNSCQVDHPIENFPFRDRTKKYRRKQCRLCDCKARKKRKQSKKSLETYKRDKEREKSRRANSRYRPIFIVSDSRKWDKKKGFENDLTVDFVTELIKDGCSYCGDSETRMTVDRKENDVGHTMKNSVACCYRCNMIRGNMPYEAFLNIAPAIRQTRENGLFKDWVGGIHR